MSKYLDYVEKHLVSLVVVVVLVAIMVATSGCGAVDGLVGDVAGTATALRKWTAPLAAKARANDAEENAKWLTVWQAEQSAFAAIGYDPYAFPVKNAEGK